MKRHEKCPKCKGTNVEAMHLSSKVALDFGTYYLGDMVIPKLYVCLNCGYCETWIDSQKDLDDIKKFTESRATMKGHSSKAPPSDKL
jgi:predicted nucleic-acid-binding Zn-ribbon protein